MSERHTSPTDEGNDWWVPLASNPPTEGEGEVTRGELVEVGVRCQRCEGQPFMLTCHHVNGTEHEDTLAVICVGCRTVLWFDGGCADCRGELEAM
jgi:hypothetical protein